MLAFSEVDLLAWMIIAGAGIVAIAIVCLAVFFLYAFLSGAHNQITKHLTRIDLPGPRRPR